MLQPLAVVKNTTINVFKIRERHRVKYHYNSGLVRQPLLCMKKVLLNNWQCHSGTVKVNLLSVYVSYSRFLALFCL